MELKEWLIKRYVEYQHGGIFIDIPLEFWKMTAYSSVIAAFFKVDIVYAMLPALLLIPMRILMGAYNRKHWISAQINRTSKEYDGAWYDLMKKLESIENVRNTDNV